MSALKNKGEARNQLINLLEGEISQKLPPYFSAIAPHTRKNQFIVLPQGEDLIDVTVGEPGPISDINQFRESRPKFAPDQKFKGDKAYIGEQQMATPHKKRKNQELTPSQKQENKKFSATRIFVEHTIRLIKLFRVAGERFRLNHGTYEQVIFTVCGLVRLRIGALVLLI